jgi:multimeric flavodoxin WrbA
MKVLMISGSRNPEGQTARAANAVLAGAEKAGCDTIQVYLPAKDVECCRQCEDSGWGRCSQDGSCIIDDDLAALVDQIEVADAVVFANPVYYGSLSESMRAFTDRLRRIARGGTKERIEGKPTVGVCVAGGRGGGGPTCCVDLEKVLRTCGFDVVDMIPARRQNLATKVAQLELVGEWLATMPRSG